MGCCPLGRRGGQAEQRDKSSGHARSGPPAGAPPTPSRSPKPPLHGVQPGPRLMSIGHEAPVPTA